MKIVDQNIPTHGGAWRGRKHGAVSLKFWQPVFGLCPQKKGSSLQATWFLYHLLLCWEYPVPATQRIILPLLPSLLKFLPTTPLPSSSRERDCLWRWRKELSSRRATSIVDRALLPRDCSGWHLSWEALAARAADTHSVASLIWPVGHRLTRWFI